MAAKLDMGRAWNEAVASISANRDMVLIVAGVFFLLPNLMLSMLAPGAAQPPAMPAGAEANLEQVTAQLSAWFAEVWWMYAAIAVLQAVGTLALLALLTDRDRPTVGEAIGFGVKALPTYLATQIIISLGVGLAGGAAIMVAQVVPLLGVLLVLLAMVFVLYAMIKLSLITPAIAIEKEMNPVAALKRSWRLTKGNSLLILGFFLLLLVAFVVISIVVGLVLAAFSLLGDDVGLIVSAVGNGLVSMVMVTVMLAALAAVHRQLSAGNQMAQTFE